MSKYLTDGHSTRLSCVAFPALKFKIKTITPMGFDGGDKNDITTMENVTVQTFAPQKLYMVSDCTATVAYDPVVLNDMPSVLNQNLEWQITHSDGSKWTNIWASLTKFTPGENKKGEQPTASITLSITNYDASEAEVVPTYVAAP